ncbi:protein NETWORKED 2D [Lingula anatina]|uniref:Protein NETWORKED 2D n=1 Tax=Lingula anatina TaxID=7574 RepID=A0A1S3JSC3_LINAN|nr:protein NETWORKED 2D [Lingula anatina]XP_013412998.1 protein NETWORKED 2D [Lingula anatina]XP_013413006.1 protein NETWORKED 2D [Lingula anatina]|eukprot:XP_013412988.1 protein NETWORKED 2D [Lingula anatina]
MENDRIAKVQGRDKKNSKPASEDFPVEQSKTRNRTSSESPLSQRRKNKDDEKKRTRTKRPEVQVYVPRGRRTQDVSPLPTDIDNQLHWQATHASRENSRENVPTQQRVKTLEDAAESETAAFQVPQLGRSRKSRPSAQVYVPRQRRQQAQDASSEDGIKVDTTDETNETRPVEEPKGGNAIAVQDKPIKSENERNFGESSSGISVINSYDKNDSLRELELTKLKTCKHKKHKHNSKSEDNLSNSLVGEEKGNRKRKLNNKHKQHSRSPLEHSGKMEASPVERRSPINQTVDDEFSSTSDGKNALPLVQKEDVVCNELELPTSLNKGETSTVEMLLNSSNINEDDKDKDVDVQSDVHIGETLKGAESSDSVYSDAQQSVQGETDHVEMEQPCAQRLEEETTVLLMNYSGSEENTLIEGESLPVDLRGETVHFQQSTDCLTEENVNKEETISNTCRDTYHNGVCSEETTQELQKEDEVLEMKNEPIPEHINETNRMPTEINNINKVEFSEKDDLIDKNCTNPISDKSLHEENLLVTTCNTSYVSEENVEQTQDEDEEEAEDSWDKMFDDDGECLDPKLMEELTVAVGKVKVQKPQFDYLNFQPKDPELDQELYGHLIEIYDFPKEFETRDLITAFQAFMSRGFDIKWVDDTHAIGVFASAVAAQDALCMTHPLFKTRPVSQATRQTKVKAKRCTEFLQPYKPRPETTAAAARRLVAGALGIATNVPREKRELERKQLKEAKERKRQQSKLKRDAWDGTIGGRCAMDIEDD